MEKRMTQPWTTNHYIRHLINYRFGLFAINAFLWGLMHSMPALIGLIIKGVFDSLAGISPISAWTFLALLIVTDLMGMGILALAFRAWAVYWNEIELLLRRNILDYILNARGARHLPESPGEAVSRFRDDVDEVIQLIEGWSDFSGFAIFAVVALTIMFNIDPLMTLAMCLPLVVIFLFTKALVPTIRRYRKRSRIATEAVTDFIGEMFTSVQAVKVAGKYESVLDHFKSLNNNRRQAALKDTLLVELLHGLNLNMVNIGTSIVLIFAAFSMRNGFSVGDFALFISYLPRLTGVMAYVGDMIAVQKRTGVSIERMNKLMQDAPAEQLVCNERIALVNNPSIKAATPLVAKHPAVVAPPLKKLTIKGLSYTYPEGIVGIQNIDLEIEQGSFTVITGPVGSGKTTLLKVLLGLLPKDSGEIYWNDELVTDPASFFVPPRSAFTAQVPKLFSDTLKENILLGSSEENLLEAVDLAVLGEDLGRLEQGLKTKVGTRGVKLSGGQVQRSAAARMFAQNTELMVFDDLSSALDIKTEQILWQKLFSKDKVTSLVVSHRRAVLENADKVVVLNAGKIEPK